MAETGGYEREANVRFWNIHSRSILKLTILDSRILKRARDLRRRGALQECLAELAKDPASESDPEALNTAGLALLGLGRNKESLEKFNRAESLLRQRLCDISVNRAVALFADGDAVSAEAAAWDAVELVPGEVAAWVNLLAIRRFSPDKISEIVGEMKRRWPAWKDSGELKRCLFEDATLSHVRRHPRFGELFHDLLGGGSK